MGSSKKKKKSAAQQVAGQQLLQQWSDSVGKREVAFKAQVLDTVKRQLSRKQRRAAVAGWGDSSPKRGPQLGAQYGIDSEQAEPVGATESPMGMPQALQAASNDVGAPLSGNGCNMPHSPASAHSGKASARAALDEKGQEQRQLFPQQQQETAEGSSAATLCFALRSSPPRHQQQKQQRQPSALDFAVMANDGQAGNDAETRGSAVSSPQCHPAGDGFGFVVLADSPEAEEEQLAGAAAVGKSEDETEGEAAAWPGCTFRSGAATAPLSSAFSFGGTTSAGQVPLQKALFGFGAVVAAAAPSAEETTASFFSGGGTAGLQQHQPPQQQQRHHFAFTTSSPPASEAAPPSAAVGDEAEAAPRLLSGAELVAMSSSEEEGSCFFSAMGSRAPSAALTAYASAQSLSRSGDDSPTRNSGAMPLGVLQSSAVGAEAAPSADAAGEGVLTRVAGPAAVLVQLQQTAQLLSASAVAAAEEEDEAAGAAAAEDEGSSGGAARSALAVAPAFFLVGTPPHPPHLSPSPFVGKPFMGSVAQLVPPPSGAALQQQQQQQQKVFLPERLPPQAGAAAAMAGSPQKPPERIVLRGPHRLPRCHSPAAMSQAPAAAKGQPPSPSCSPAAAAVCSPAQGTSAAASPCASRPLLFQGSPLARQPQAYKVAQAAEKEPLSHAMRLSQMAPWSPAKLMAAGAATAAADAHTASAGVIPSPAASPAHLRSLPQSPAPPAGQQRSPAQLFAEAAASPEAATAAAATVGVTAPTHGLSLSDRSPAPAPVAVADSSREPSPVLLPATAAAMRALRLQCEQGPSPTHLVQVAQRHLMCAIEMLPSTSCLSGATSAMPELSRGLTGGLCGSAAGSAPGEGSSASTGIKGEEQAEQLTCSTAVAFSRNLQAVTTAANKLRVSIASSAASSTETAEEEVQRQDQVAALAAVHESLARSTAEEQVEEEWEEVEEHLALPAEAAVSAVLPTEAEAVDGRWFGAAAAGARASVASTPASSNADAAAPGAGRQDVESTSAFAGCAAALVATELEDEEEDEEKLAMADALSLAEDALPEAVTAAQLPIAAAYDLGGLGLAADSCVGLPGSESLLMLGSINGDMLTPGGMFSCVSSVVAARGISSPISSPAAAARGPGWFMPMAGTPSAAAALAYGDQQEGLLPADPSEDGSCGRQAAAGGTPAAEGVEDAEEGRSLLQQREWRQRSDSPQWQQPGEEHQAGDESGGGTTALPATGNRNPYGLSPLLGSFLAVQQEQQQQPLFLTVQQQLSPSAAAANASIPGANAVASATAMAAGGMAGGAGGSSILRCGCGDLPAAALQVQLLSRSASGAFVTARSEYSRSGGAAEGEQALAGGEKEVASPSTEPLWYSLAANPNTLQLAHQPSPEPAAAAPNGWSGIFPAAAAGMSLQEGSSGNQPRQRQAGSAPGSAAAAAGAGWGATGSGGEEGKEAGADGGWRPHGQWQLQKEQLLLGQHERNGSGIPAVWGQQLPLAEQAAAEQVQHKHQQQVQVQEAAMQSSLCQQSINGGRGHTSLARRSGTVAAAAAATAVAGTVGAAPGSLQGFPLRNAAGASVPPAQAFSPDGLQFQQYQQQSTAAAGGLSTPQKAAAAVAFAAAATPVAKSPMPAVVPPSPAQYSPESWRYRQQVQQQLTVRAPPAAVAAAEGAEPGQYSPGSQLYRHQAQAAASAVSQMQLQRMLSDQQQHMEQEVGKVAGERETAQQQQQEEQAAAMAALAIARLAEAGQMSPMSALEALRASLAVMAPPAGCAWASQQQQVQGILGRVEESLRVAWQRAEEVVEQRHELEQQVFALQQQVKELQGQADDADTLKLELLEARREAQELQQERRRHWDLEQRELAAVQQQREADKGEARAAALSIQRDRLRRRQQRDEEERGAAALSLHHERLALERQQLQLRQQGQQYECQQREEQLRQEQQAAATARRHYEQQRRWQATVHPYDALYHSVVKQQMDRQQGQQHNGPNQQQQPRQQLAACGAAVSPQVHRQYATISSTMGGGPLDSRAECMQHKAMQHAVAAALDSRPFSPLGAGAVLLTQKQRRRAAAAGQAAAAAHPHYHAIG